MASCRACYAETATLQAKFALTVIGQAARGLQLEWRKKSVVYG